MTIDLTWTEHGRLCSVIATARQYYLHRATEVMPQTGVHGVPDEPAEHRDQAGACGWMLAATALDDLMRSLEKPAAEPSGPFQIRRECARDDHPPWYTATIGPATVAGAGLIAAIYNAYIAAVEAADRDQKMLNVLGRISR